MNSKVRRNVYPGGVEKPAAYAGETPGPQGSTSGAKLPLRRSELICLVSLLLLTLATWVPRWSGPIDLRWDGGTYFILGTSLAQGKGYRLLNEPGEIRANQYPPLLPAIIAVHEKILHSSDPVKVGIWLRRTWILFSIAYVLMSFLLARLFTSVVYSFWVAFICMMSFDMYYLATLCFTELPFALAAVLFAWTYLRKSGQSSTRYLTPVFAVMGYLLRSMGIALLAAWVGDALLRRQFRTGAIRAAIALLPVLAWQSYTHNVESSPDYKHPYYAYQRDPSMFYNVSYAVNMKLKDPFKPDSGNATLGDYSYRFFHNVLLMPSTLGQSVTAREFFFKAHFKSLNRFFGRWLLPQWPYKLLLNVLGLLVLLGTVILVLRRQYLVGFTIALTLAAVCTTPWPGQFARYLAPILPLLLLAVLAAVGGTRRANPSRDVVTGKWTPRIRWVVIGVIACECCFAFQSGTRNFLNTASYRDANGHSHSYRLVHYSMEYPEVEAALQWLVPRAQPNAVLAVSMPQWVYLHSGLKSVMPPLTRNPQQAEELIDTVPVSYVIVEKLLMDDNFNVYFPKLVERSPDKWKLIYSAPEGDVQIYGRVGVARISGTVLTD